MTSLCKTWIMIWFIVLDLAERIFHFLKLHWDCHMSMAFCSFIAIKMSFVEIWESAAGLDWDIPLSDTVWLFGRNVITSFMVQFQEHLLEDKNNSFVM